MRNSEKSFSILIVLFFNIYGLLLPTIGSVAASDGPAFPRSGSKLLDNRPAIKTDHELEDTIREINRFALSDSLWHIWRAIEDSQVVVAKIDTVNSLKNFAKGVKLAKEGFELLNELKQQNLDSMTVQKIKYKAILLFEKARTSFEITFRLNPFDIRTQNYLIWIFQNLAELHDNCNNTSRAIAMLECLTYIMHDDPRLYYTLGEKYFNIGRWDRALTCIKTSIDLILDDDWNKIDTKELFWHYYLKANTEIQLNMIPEALLSLNYAKLIVPSEKEGNEVMKKIDWINWDDGNIRASRTRDSLDSKLNSGIEDYAKIKQEYLNLLRQVETAGAKQDIQWRIAQLEFRFLNQKEQAVERMLHIVKQIAIDSTNKAQNSAHQKYLNDYGSMCYILGTENLKLGYHKKAFIYFFQSIEFWWNQIGKSYHQLAKLSELDNQSLLKFAKLALANEDHLSEEERNSLFYLFYLAYKRMGMFENAAQWFEKIVDNRVG